MQIFSPPASKLREEREVAKGAREGQVNGQGKKGILMNLNLNFLQVLFMNFYREVKKGISEFEFFFTNFRVVAHGGFCIYQYTKSVCLLN